MQRNKKEIKEQVKKGYAKIAQQGGSCCPTSSCCGKTASLTQNISKTIGYTEAEMNAVPEGANLGLGCGNPVAIASLKEGEIVLDLGSGAGFDAFLAAAKVGEKGKVIGVDMTSEMLKRARENAIKGGYRNVEFRQGDIERLPIESNTVDAVISNCVINLSLEKRRVFKEAFRVLKPGGRLMVSDLVLLKNLPDAIKESVEAYVDCLAGAARKEDYLMFIKEAGFKDIKVISQANYPIKAMSADLAGIEGSIASLKVYAVKPREESKK